MQTIIAIDSFKGSLSSAQAGQAAALGVHDALPDATVRSFPVADGGEGTVQALCEGLHGQIYSATVTDPLGGSVKAGYGILPDNTAVIEMAEAAGLPLVPPDKRNPLNTTTYGVGELILAAAQKGARRFIIGIGGSATNDGGLGMLCALGAKFLRADNQPAGIFGKDLADIVAVDMRDLNPLLNDCRFQIACDVANPLCGDNGCSAVFAPQKGATSEIVRDMDRHLANFAAIVEAATGRTGAAAFPGAGAAGGLGFAFMAALNGQLRRGIDIVMNAVGLVGALDLADLVIVGEGRLDGQSIMGKAPIGIARLAKERRPSAVTVAVCGMATDDAAVVLENGIDAYFPIIAAPCTAREAMAKETAQKNIRRTVAQIVRLLAKTKR